MLGSSLLAVTLVALFAVPASAGGTLGGIDRNAPRHLYLVKDCGAAGWDSTDIDFKCFESVGNLNYALWGDPDPENPAPTAANPVIVDIGPGEFSGVIECPDGEGYVTFRGAGRDRTVIKGVSHGNGFSISAVSATNCNGLGFQDIRLEAVSPSPPLPYGVAVSWIGGGSSTWTDVDIQGNDYGWYDIVCPNDEPGVVDPPTGVHYFWGSKVVGGSESGYLSECGETWYYGGEIAGLSSVRGSFINNLSAVWVNHRAHFHMFGSAVRVSTANVLPVSGTNKNVYGVRVGDSATGHNPNNGNGEFHSHGGVISVNSSNLSNVAATGLRLKNYATGNPPTGGGNAKAHTLETGFAVKGGSGSTSTRLSGSGVFESPHLWEARVTPPPAGGAIDGQDIYVETDCSIAPSGCVAPGTNPHLMVYKSSCSPSPWFDTVRNGCRVGE